jgi:hypothetical protein
MGPSLADALLVTVAYPRASRLSSSRVLRIPLSSLSGMMYVLHEQGAVVTHVVASVVEVEPSELDEKGAEQTTPSRKRSKKIKEHC